MIAVLATLRAKAGAEEALEHAFAEMTARVRANEPGVRLYQLTRSRDEPGLYKVLEMYVDDAAFQAHGASDHYRKGVAKMADLAQGRSQIEVLDVLD